MNRYEASDSLTPPLPHWVDPYNLGAELHRTEARLSQTRHELTEARAEVDRLTRGLCSLLLHDSARYGRVATPNVVRLLLGEPMPWEAT